MTNIRAVTTIGKRVAGARRKARLTQSEMARRAGLTRSWVVSVETDRIAQPQPDKLRRLTAEIGLDYREMLAITNQLGEVPATPSVDVDALRGEAIAALIEASKAQTEAVKEQTNVLRGMLELMRDQQERSISPETLGVFLEMMHSEGVLATPDRPASTDEVLPPSAATQPKARSGSRA